jgi:hypothetical protein
MGRLAGICAFNIVIKFLAQKSLSPVLGDNQATAGEIFRGGQVESNKLADQISTIAFFESAVQGSPAANAGFWAC